VQDRRDPVTCKCLPSIPPAKKVVTMANRVYYTLKHFPAAFHLDDGKKHGAQSQPAPFPPITAPDHGIPQGKSPRNPQRPINHAGASTGQSTATSTSPAQRRSATAPVFSLVIAARAVHAQKWAQRFKRKRECEQRFDERAYVVVRGTTHGDGEKNWSSSPRACAGRFHRQTKGGIWVGEAEAGGVAKTEGKCYAR